MSKFIELQTAVAVQSLEMMDSAHGLYNTSADPEKLKEVYLSAFEDGTDPMFRERTEHNCNCCLKFLSKIGGVVTYIDGKIVTLWDFEIDGIYAPVVKALREYVLSCSVGLPYLSEEAEIGTQYNFEGNHRWDHFYTKLTDRHIVPEGELASFNSKLDSYVKGIESSFELISDSSIELVKELIDDDNLARGPEFKDSLNQFKALKEAVAPLSKLERHFNLYSSMILAVRKSMKSGVPLKAFKNKAIGTLLVAITEGTDFEQAVISFEKMVSGDNYKRPKATVFTKSMQKRATEVLEKHGLVNAISRRPAVLSDLTANNVLFSNKNALTGMSGGSLFDDFVNEDAAAGLVDKATPINISRFIQKVLPETKKLELLFDRELAGNLFSLVAPVDPEAGNLFTWDNNFSWTYRGEMADSGIAERVKSRGGEIDTDFRVSLSWTNRDDLDIGLVTPSGTRIYYGQPRRRNFSLDVDANYTSIVENPVENIRADKGHTPEDGKYIVYVMNNGRRDGRHNDEFLVEVEVFGNRILISGKGGTVNTSGNTIVEVFVKDGKVTFSDARFGEVVSSGVRSAWGLDSGKFYSVNMVMNSPNFWDGQQKGNRHIFFSVEGCKSDEPSRGFYNEFLLPELQSERKAFEIIGSRMKAPVTDEPNQVHGVGFPITKRGKVVVKADGRPYLVSF